MIFASVFLWLRSSLFDFSDVEDFQASHLEDKSRRLSYDISKLTTVVNLSTLTSLTHLRDDSFAGE